MKNLIILGLIILSCSLSAIDFPSEIKQVTVYQNNARVTREANITVSPGINKVVFGGLASAVNQQSLQVDISGPATLLSANMGLNYLTPVKVSARIKELRDSLSLVETTIKKTDALKMVYNGEEKLMQENIKLGSEEAGFTVPELKLLADFYRIRMKEIKNEQVQIDLLDNQLKKTKSKLQHQLNQLSSRDNQPSGEVHLSISSNLTTKITITYTYLVFQAGWFPVYDIRSRGPGEPINIVYKAQVHQHTGKDWDNIAMTISTRNPTADQNRPVLQPWYIDFKSPAILYESLESAAPRSRKSEMLSNMAIIEDDEAMGSAPVYQVQEVQGTMAVEYKIKNLQNVPADGDNHLMLLKEEKVPAIFTYHAVPKLSENVFLLAKIPDFGTLNLLPGNANLFNEGMYIGQSHLNPSVASDTMLLSLGKDQKISIERHLLDDFTSKQFIGQNVKIQRGYEIVIKNNKPKPVVIEIIDQLPISTNEDIEVELMKAGGAKYNGNYGRLIWREEIGNGELRKLQFSYTVKYPKGKNVDGF